MEFSAPPHKRHSVNLGAKSQTDCQVEIGLLALIYCTFLLAHFFPLPIMHKFLCASSTVIILVLMPDIPPWLGDSLCILYHYFHSFLTSKVRWCITHFQLTPSITSDTLPLHLAYWIYFIMLYHILLYEWTFYFCIYSTKPIIRNFDH